MKSIILSIDKKHSKDILKETNIYIESGNYSISENCFYAESPSTVQGITLSNNFKFKIGAFSHINAKCFIQNCTIGRYCAIGTGVKIGNGNHPTNWLSVNACQYIQNFHNYEYIFPNKINLKNFKPYKHTLIGNDVWIGANVFIKDGVTIGDGAIIGANSVVTHDVEPYAIVAGTPAKIIRYRFTPEIINQLLDLKWWDYNITEFGSVDFDNIENAIKQLKNILPTLNKYYPKTIDSHYILKKTQPYKKQLCGLITTRIDFNYKSKYFAGIRIYKKNIKE